MEYLEIIQSEVEGMVLISGSKNISLPLICSCLLKRGKYHFENVPDIKDVRTLLTILNVLNVSCELKNNTLILDSSNYILTEIPFELIKMCRASYYLLGAILTQYEELVFTYPGGCSFQERPINYHLDAFRNLGFDIKNEEDKILFRKVKKESDEITFPKASVGATINVLLYASTKLKKLVINNPSHDFEVKEIINYLNKMGCFIYYEGNKLYVYGTNNLSISKYCIPYDRIEAGTYILLGLMCGKLLILGVDYQVNKSLFDFLDNLKVPYVYSHSSIKINRFTPSKSVKITLSNDPSLHTDLGPILCVFLATNNKICIIEDLIYEKRNGYIEELKKLGFKIKIINSKIIIFPHSTFKEAVLYGKDLRGTMSLLCASILSKKKIKLYGQEFLQRGYENYLEKLKNINVNIRSNYE